MKKLITIWGALCFCCWLAPNAAAQADSLSYEIDAVQYFYDTDPGVGNAGNGGVVNITPVNPLNQTFNFPLPAAITDGLHYLYVRVRDTSHRWSLSERQVFFVSQNVGNPTLADVTAIQYYFNDDPGVGVAGNGGIISIPPDSAVNPTISAPLPASLPLGLNYLYIRVQNTAGTWSLTERQVFYIFQPPSLQTEQITALEFYYDNDPGVGNGQRIDIAPPTDSLNQAYQIPAPCLPDGTHYLYVRAQNQAGIWSLTDMDTLVISSGIAASVVTPAGPLDLCPGDTIPLSAPSGVGVSYQWLRNGAEIAGAISASYDVLMVGDYELRAVCDGDTSLSNTVIINQLIPLTFFADVDGDGFGNPNDSVADCFQPVDFVLDNQDCNDADSTINPAAAEICDGIDNNCSGEIDEGVFARDTITAEICQGESFLFLGNPVTMGGSFDDTLVVTNLCDTIFTLNLTVNPVFNDTTAAVEICQGDSVSVFGNFQNSAGLFVDSSQTVDGCDSVTFTEVIVNPNFLDTLPAVSVCAGNSTLIFSQSQSAAGFYVDSNLSADGCDSVSFQELMVNPIFNDTTLPMQICAGDSALIFGNFENTAGIFTNNDTAVNGCDSITTTELQVVPSIQTKDTLAICQGDSISIFGNFENSAGVFADTSVSSGGCDSIATVCLVINPVDTVSMTSTTMDSTMAGVFTTVLTNSLGCDSVVIDTVIFTGTPCPPADTGRVTSFTCDSAMAGIFYTMLTTSAGCDSILETTVIFDAGSTTPLPMVVICEGDSALIFGNFQTMAGTFADTLMNANGCDSILTQTLVVNPISNDTLMLVQICEGDSALIFGNFQTMGGTFADTLMNANGCDSILTQMLVVNPVSNDTLAPMQICQGDSTLIFGNFESVAGFFTDSAQSGNGCDSLTTVELRVVPSLQSKDPLTICEGDSVSIFGNFETMAGTFTDTTVSSGGCDSIATICLLVNDSNMVTVQDSICPNDSIFVGGAFQTMAGVYTDLFTNQNGCDSLVITNVALRTDSACLDTAIGDTSCQIVCYSDSTWMESTVVTASNLSGNWNGVNGNLPPTASYTMQATLGQPYSFPSIEKVDANAPVIKSGNNIRYFRKTFGLLSADDVEAELRMTFDDQTEVYVNGNLLAGEYNLSRSNWKLPAHEADYQSNSSSDGGQAFDFKASGTAGIFQTGMNEVVVVLRNFNKPNDRGGFSFELQVDCDAGQPLTDSLVSDTGWSKSTVVTPSNNVGFWSGVAAPPADSTFTLPVDIGQPYGFPTIEAVDGSQVIKSENNITYFKRTFEVVDSTGLNARFQMTFDDAVEVYLNGVKLFRENNIGSSHWRKPAHDILFAPAAVFNGHLGNDAYDFVGPANSNGLFREGENCLIVALRNFGKSSDRGGFSFRLDLDDNGAPVIVQKTSVVRTSAPAMPTLAFEVFPNPTDGRLHIDFSEYRDLVEVQLFDLQGKHLQTHRYQQRALAELDLSGLADGLYFVHITADGQSQRVKVLKE